jgi:hypothetical protein
MVPALILIVALAINYFFPFDLKRPFPPPSYQAKRPITAGLLLLLSLSIAIPFAQRVIMLPFGELPEPIFVAQALNKYSDKGYTLIVTEAGRIPYYADWRSIDAYGLNDPYIAHYGYSDAYLDSFNAEVIMFNSAKYGANSTIWEADQDPWEILCKNMRNYCQSRNYTLACIYRVYLRFGLVGTLVIGHQWFYVRNDFADSAAIYNDLRSIPTADYIYL